MPDGSNPPAQDMTSTMTGAGAQPVDEAVCPCNEGNLLWLENHSGQSVSATVSVGGVSSPVLPETSDVPTLLPNDLGASSGPIEMNINGQNIPVLPGIDPSLLQRPEDIQVGLVCGRSSGGRSPIDASGGIPVDGNAGEVDISQFLAPGVTEANSEIDLVVVCEGASGPGAVGAGTHSIETLQDAQLHWVLTSIAQNVIANSTNEAANLAMFALDVYRDGAVRVRTALRELLFQGRFVVKPIAAWGGKLGIVFKGAHRSRSFLTAFSYGLRHNRMAYISSYADAAAGQGWNVGRSVAKGNMIGFVISAGFDVAEFWNSEDPEANWGDLLGALSVTFVKVWIAGFVGVMGAGLIAAGVVAAGAAALPVLAVVGIGVGISIAVGVFLDGVDNWLGIKDAARRFGRGAVASGARFAANTVATIRAVISFIETIENGGVDGLINGWVRDVEQHLRENDPNGWCFLFCSDDRDRLNALSRGLGLGDTY